VTEFEQLHPSLQYHVVNTLGWSSLRPTQLAAISPIHTGKHCLLLAPTAGGKTEAAAIPILSKMLKESWPGTSVLYICPIKALLNNLEHRLSHYAGLVGRTVEVWHGDVSQSRKQKALNEAPDILLTTPESIEAMLISVRVDRPAWFGNLRAVVVDELHAFASDDRGWHLRSVLQRLEHYMQQPLQRIGLSATVSNPEQLLTWFAPVGERQVVGSASVSTEADVTIDHVGNLENAATVISRLHRGQKRLVFCDSRSSAEQLSSMLRAKDVRTFVSHASLSATERRQAEAAFSEEKDCVIVATSTLELGIDVGDLDRVIQIDSPSTVSSFLQRMGRTGRRSGSLRNCLFLTTSQDSLMLSLGITRLWSQTWVEAAYPPEEPWPIVGQQILVATLERGEWPINEAVALLAQCFPELPVECFKSMLFHMAQQGFLVTEDRLLRIGPETEREFGRGHYRDLLASFSGSQLLTGRFGSAEVGYIDPTMLTGDKPERLLLLAGRSWLIKEIEWGKKVVWLEPAKEGGKARWMGGARSLSRDICQGIRGALVEGVPPVVHLSKRAEHELAALRAELDVSADAHFMPRHEGGHMRTWTFAGTKQNRTYARAAANGGARVKFDALSVQAPAAALIAGGGNEVDLDLTDLELAAFAEGIKFASCVPSDLLSRSIAARMFVSGPGRSPLSRGDLPFEKSDAGN
jgi:ATP-dependent Lhr-like helicase